MKRPYLNKWERDVLKLNRDNLIWTPTWLIRYELMVSWRIFTRELFRIIKNWRLK